jgi:hypothetical protein
MALGQRSGYEEGVERVRDNKGIWLILLTGFGNSSQALAAFGVHFPH